MRKTISSTRVVNPTNQRGTGIEYIMDTIITADNLLSAIYFLIPAYTANSTPILLGGGPPIDFDSKFIDGKRIFGSNKTIQGFLAGLTIATLVAVIETFLLSIDYITIGFMIALGALCGDLTGAFIKRRMDLKPGSPLPLLDQLDFIFGALLITNPFLKLEPGTLFIIILATPPIHLLSNAFAYILKLKEKYW